MKTSWGNPVHVEVEGDSKDPALWAKAMALTGGNPDMAKYEYIKLRVWQLAKSKADVQKEYGVHEAKAEAVEQVADIDNASGISGSEVSKEDARKHDPPASETPKDAVGAVAAYDLQTVRKKAKAGDAEAHFNFVDFLRKRAERGCSSTQFNLGLIYAQRSVGVPQDAAEAVKWFRKAAEQGHDAAQLNLGLMYKAGRGVPQDDVAAYAWFSVAMASRGVLDFDGIYRKIIYRKLTTSQIKKGQAMGLEIFERVEKRKAAKAPKGTILSGSRQLPVHDPRCR